MALHDPRKFPEQGLLRRLAALDAPQFRPEALQVRKPVRVRAFPLVGEVVRLPGEGVNELNGVAQPPGKQPGGDREVLVVADRHGVVGKAPGRIAKSLKTLAFSRQTGVRVAAEKAGLYYTDGRAKVAELVDALDLGSSAARRESSSLSFRTRAGRRAAALGELATSRDPRNGLREL